MSVSVSVSAAGLGGVFGVSFDVLRLVGAAGWGSVAAVMTSLSVRGFRAGCVIMSITVLCSESS